MHHHLQKHVAKLLTEVFVVIVVDGIYHLARFFHQTFLQGLVSLFYIPRASAGSSESRYYFHQIAEAVLLGGF